MTRRAVALVLRLYELSSQGAAAVTVDSPEKQRVGIIDLCHGAAGQVWPAAEVAAAAVLPAIAVGL